MYGIGAPELLIFIVLPLFIWFSIKIYKYSIRQLKKVDDVSPDSEDDQKGFLKDIDISDIRFIADNLVSENEVVSFEEEIPLDNSHGSSPIVSEHEFSRTVSNSLRIDKEKGINGLVKTNLWTLIQTEVKKNLTKTIGAEIGEQITRRVTVRLEAAPGKIVRYKLIWKQKQRTGNALIRVKNKEIPIPYTTMYGLFHSVQSVDVEIGNHGDGHENMRL